MKKLLLIPLLSLVCVGCDQPNRSPPPPPKSNQIGYDDSKDSMSDRDRNDRDLRDGYQYDNAGRNASDTDYYDKKDGSWDKDRHDRALHDEYKYDSDNTGRNVRDRYDDRVTPFDQSESSEDRTISQQIRQSLMRDDSLSNNAKNIKIITINRVVTLRGPVENSNEKNKIEDKASSVNGVSQVVNQLEVVSHKNNNKY